eukprot:TRINITY_DN24550_c0_g2_i1.p1 TRINITY_DN24550_c0_g2~~TRINITY_DN24550_c0_g2_i1.p1  ORF type:complete len:325 (+),score=67.94 TRINITY_DN24550_c0_g2_i1:258-1232(+)
MSFPETVSSGPGRIDSPQHDLGHDLAHGCEESDCEDVMPLIASSDPERLCRICYCGDEAGELFQPCRCRGSLAWIHRECLDRWRSSESIVPFQRNTEKFNRCEVCHYVYRFSEVENAPKLDQRKLNLLVARDVLLSIIILHIPIFVIYAILASSDNGQPFLSPALPSGWPVFVVRYLSAFFLFSAILGFLVIMALISNAIVGTNADCSRPCVDCCCGCCEDAVADSHAVVVHTGPGHCDCGDCNCGNCNCGNCNCGGGNGDGCAVVLVVILVVLFVIGILALLSFFFFFLNDIAEKRRRKMLHDIVSKQQFILDYDPRLDVDDE